MAVFEELVQKSNPLGFQDEEAETFTDEMSFQAQDLINSGPRWLCNALRHSQRHQKA